MAAWLAWLGAAWLVLSIASLAVLLLLARLEDRQRTKAEDERAAARDEASDQ